MNSKEFKNDTQKVKKPSNHDLLYDKYNFTEFAKEPYMQGGLRTKKLVEIGEELIKKKYENK